MRDPRRVSPNTDEPLLFAFRSGTARMSYLPSGGVSEENAAAQLSLVGVVAGPTSAAYVRAKGEPGSGVGPSAWVAREEVIHSLNKAYATGYRTLSCAGEETSSMPAGGAGGGGAVDDLSTRPTRFFDLS